MRLKKHLIVAIIITLFGAGIWYLVTSKDISKLPENLLSHKISNTPYTLALNSKWSQKDLNVFLKECNSKVFCPTLNISVQNHDFVNYSDDELAKEILDNLILKYKNVNIKGAFHVESEGLLFRCFDFILMNDGHHFGTTLVVGPNGMIITFLALNEPPGAYVDAKNELLTLLNGIILDK